MMEMRPVQSSNIDAVGYNPETREMRIQFKGGGKYAFHGISPEQHKALVNAPSVGGHFAAHIRPKFRGKKL